MAHPGKSKEGTSGNDGGNTERSGGGRQHWEAGNEEQDRKHETLAHGEPFSNRIYNGLSDDRPTRIVYSGIPM